MAFVQYINPAQDVFNGRIGRKLVDTGIVPRPFEHYFDQLRSGEVMYVGLRGGLVPPQLVAYAHFKEGYEVFYKRYFSGAYREFAVYAIPSGLVEE